MKKEIQIDLDDSSSSPNSASILRVTYQRDENWITTDCIGTKNEATPTNMHDSKNLLNLIILISKMLNLIR